MENSIVLRADSGHNSSSSSRRNSDEMRIMTPPKNSKQIANRVSPSLMIGNKKVNLTPFIIIRLLISIIILVILLFYIYSFIISLFSQIIKRWRYKREITDQYNRVVGEYDCFNKTNKVKIKIDVQKCAEAERYYYGNISKIDSVLQMTSKSLAESLNSFFSKLQTPGFFLIVILISILTLTTTFM